MTNTLRVRCSDCGVYADVTVENVRHTQKEIVELVTWYLQVAGIKEPVRCRWVRSSSAWLSVTRYGSAKRGFRFVVDIDVQVLALPMMTVQFRIAHECSEIRHYAFSENIEKLHDTQAKLWVMTAHKAGLLPPQLFVKNRHAGL